MAKMLIIRANIELQECEKNVQDLTSFISKIKKCLSLEALNRAMVVELIDTIEVSNVYELNGEKQMDLKIKFKFKYHSVVEAMAV